MAILVLLLLGFGWWAAEVQFGGEAGERLAAGPEWRRTSEGWIKVGSTGAAALDRPAPGRASEPTLHPGLVAAFMLLAGVLSLSHFDSTPQHRRRSTLAAAGNIPGSLA